MSVVRGIIVSGDFDKLVVQATAAEVAAFASNGLQVSVSKRINGLDPMLARIEPGQSLFDADGHLVAIVTDLRVAREQVDITSLGSMGPEFIPGCLRVDIRARGVVE